MTQPKQDKRPSSGKNKPQRAKQVRRVRKPHPTDGWFSIGERAHLKEA